MVCESCAVRLRASSRCGAKKELAFLQCRISQGAQDSKFEPTDPGSAGLMCENECRFRRSMNSLALVCQSG